MMASLFSSFDPSTSWGIPLNWTSTVLGLFIVPFTFWLIPSRMEILWFKIINSLHAEFKILLGLSKMSGGTLIFVSLFSLIVFSNFMGLFPYIFTSTSHLSMSLSMALPIWLSFMLFGWLNNTNHMLAHQVPQGTPPILMPFMVCIETISNLIRPGTLAVRLSANMIAGHLLMTLLGNTGSSLAMSMISVLIIVQLLLILLETAVSIIQSYVFAVLSTLYSSEVI